MTNNNSSNNSWKRIAAGVLSLALVVGTMPSIAGGKSKGNNAFAAVAEATELPGARSYSDAEGNVFLGGNYIEVGVSKLGSFGTTSFVPTGEGHDWHPNRSSKLGLVVDNDGFNVGDAPTTGDFFIPGTPEERLILGYKIDDSAFNNCATALNGANWYSPIKELKTVDMSDVENGKLKAVTTGTTKDGLSLEQIIEFDVNDKFFKITVTLTNEGEKTLDEVRYVRSVDPDQDVDLNGTYNTYNKVICNPRSDVEYTSDQCAMVVARGYKSLEGFFYISFDKNARASRGVSFSPNSVYLSGLWTNNEELPTTPSEESIALTREMLDKSNTNGYKSEDNAVAMTFDWGSLDPGESRTGTLICSLDANVQESLEKVTSSARCDIAVPYNGGEQSVSVDDVEVTDGDGNPLVYGTDYEFTGTTSATNAGVYDFSIHYLGDYAEIADKALQWQIMKADLEVKANDKTITLGSEAADNGVAYTGFVGDEDESVLKGTLSFSFGDYTSESPAGEYVITPSGLSADNYKITYKTGVLNVVEKQSVDVDTLSVEFPGKIYDATPVAGQAFRVSGLPEDFAPSYTYTYIKDETTLESAPKDAGDYTVKIDIVDNNGIYADVELVKEFEIEKRSVSLTPVADQSIIYGEEVAPNIKYTAELATVDSYTGILASDAELAAVFADAANLPGGIKIKGFDYKNFVNDAGAYSYVLDTDALDAAVADVASYGNYSFSLAENGALFTIKPRKLTNDMFTINDPEYFYDGTKKVQPSFTALDITSNPGSDDADDGKFGGSDVYKFDFNGDGKYNESFVVKGVSAGILPGTYTIEFEGCGNYEGWISFNWYIGANKTYSAKLSVADKTYDGTAVVPSVSYDKNGESATVLPKDIKTTYTYYKYDGVSEITSDYINTLTPLTGAPKDAGSYILKAHTVARGYEFDDAYANFTIAKKQITVVPAVSSKVYGSAEPDLSDISYDTKDLVDGDTVNFTGEFALGSEDAPYDGSVGTYAVSLGSVSVDNSNYEPTISSGDFTVVPQEITDANIKVRSKCIKSTDGWAYPSNVISFTAMVNGEEVEIFSGIDFEVITSIQTKNTGKFSMQIVGIGNFTGFAAKDVEVVSLDMLREELKLTAPYATKNEDGIGRVSATLTNEIPSDILVLESGIIYVKDVNCQTELILDNIGIDDIYKKKNNSHAPSQTLNVTDPFGNGAKMRGYAVVSDGFSDFVIYTDVISDTYLGLTIDSAATVAISDAVPTVNEEGIGRVSATFTHEVAEDYTVVESGILYVKNMNSEDELVLENIGKNGIAKKINSSNVSSQTLNVTDPNADGAKMRGYVTVSSGNKTKTFYSDEVKGMYRELILPGAVTAKLSEPFATVNEEGIGRVSATFTHEVAEGYTVVESGILYVKDINCFTDLTLENIGVDGIAKKTNSSNASSQTLNVTDPDGDGAKMRGYITVTDGVITRTLYTDEVSGIYFELSK